MFKYLRPGPACMVCLAFALIALGCDSKPSEGGGSGSGGGDKTSDAASLLSGEAAKAKLTAADALDGKTDKTLYKCAPCGFAMDGSADHTLSYEGFTMRFCSASCKDGFNKDLKKAIAAMTVPKS